jgi:primosomal protein N' (replication factor Y)
MYASVLIEYEVKKLDQTFTYHIPESLSSIIKKGMKVYVPFGNSKIYGIVEDIMDTCDTTYEIKDIIDIVDPYLILNTELMMLANFLSTKTLCTKMTAYQTMLPASLKVKKQVHNYNKYDEFIYLISKNKAVEYIKNHPRRSTHIKVLEDLLIKDGKKKENYSSKSINELIKEGIIKKEKVSTYRIKKEGTNSIKELTKDQYNVYKDIIDNKDIYNTYLLYGITGSGKTEVYIKLIKDIVNNKKTALVLVPEISLTTQIAKRFYDAFSSDVAILHSALSEGEKYDEYLKILRGEVHVVVGTRSAIFAPLSNLGIIIIDEEDSSSYKQDNNPRYHARDMAIFRAKYNNIPLLLASATPSLESTSRAIKGVYKLLVLKKRVGKAILPRILIVDMNKEIKRNNQIFSDLLKEKIKEKLAKKEQIILLLNRRGYSTFITCSNCGFTYKCPNCDISLTYHKTTNNLICHYCGYMVQMHCQCPKCREKALNYYGLGTEKLEAKLCELFPTAKVVRMDQDTTRKKGAHEKIIESFKNEEYDILLGTQMISKGLDFPKVTLVGIINADTTLNIPDYRSSENTFSLLSQVAGRAGRSNLLGEVVIQTFNPDNFVIGCVATNSYDSFYKLEMSFRHRLKYPPYYYLVSVKVIGKDYETVMQDARKAKDYLDKNLENTSIVLGPTTASVFKFNNNYRMQIIIKYKFDKKLSATLKDLDRMFVQNKNSYLEIDFNPLRI